MGNKQKKIEKLLKSNKLPRHFHPAVGLLAKADMELTLIAAAAMLHDIMFTVFATEVSRFAAWVPREHGDSRRIGIFAELDYEGDKREVTIVLRLDCYQAVLPHRLMCTVLLRRRLPEPVWKLTVERSTPRKKLDSSIRHSLRRIGATTGKKARTFTQRSALDVVCSIMKDFHRLVLIPRATRKEDA